MQVTPQELPGLLLIRPRVFPDSRGFFFEIYRKEHSRHDIEEMLQVNISRSSRGVLRGMHMQMVQPQAKLISVIRGAVYDVAVDLRVGSPTFGKWCGHTLSDENHLQMYIPVGFAHGFCVLSEQVDLLYQCSDYYCPQGELGIPWNDPDIGVEWPIPNPILSPKDENHKRLAELAPERLPRYSP